MVYKDIIAKLESINIYQWLIKKMAYLVVMTAQALKKKKILKVIDNN